MFLTVGGVCIGTIQWYTNWRRYSMYRRTLSDVLKYSSLLVQRSSTGTGGIHSSFRSPLLDSHSSVKETELFSDKSSVISQLTPKLKVNLESWTAYYAVYSHSHTEKHTGNVMVLLESFRPKDVHKFISDQCAIPFGKTVHVLEHGTPVAWKTGPPFGIVMQCSMDDFSTLCMAFSDMFLSMDEDLQVLRFISVDVEGIPACLVEEKEEDTCEAITEDTSYVEDKKDAGTSLWSNESLADSNSVANMELQDFTVQGNEDQLDKLEEQDTGMTESGSGEALCDIEQFDSPIARMTKYKITGGVQAKPPNIVVYCGIKDATRKFENIKTVLEQCLNTERYVIYHLKSDLLHTTPWAENTELLVVSEVNLCDHSDDLFCQYFESGGKVISFGSNLDAMFLPRQELRSANGISLVTYDSWKSVPLLSGRFCYHVGKATPTSTELRELATDDDGQVLIVALSPKDKRDGDGKVILSQVFLDQDPTDVAKTSEAFDKLKASNTTRFEILEHLLAYVGMDCTNTTIPELTMCYLFTKLKNSKADLMKSLESRLKDNVLKSATVDLQFIQQGDQSVKATAKLLPVVTESNKPFIKYFDPNTYWNNLSSKVLGNTLLYTDVIPTTMPVLDGLQFSTPESLGLIAVAGRQTQGKGRGGNAWLSPEGCAMFTLHVRMPVQSRLGKAASYIQHITSLAVVQSVRSLPGYENVDLRLKWPNDIYYSNKIKLGGVIVRSTILDEMLHAVIGCGFNVTNTNPTICINDVIKLHNNEHGTLLVPCSKEQLLARTVSIIEEMIQQFQNEGREKFCQLYYQRWLHSGSKVCLETEGNISVTIDGIDEYGYLDVFTDDNRRFSVQPDGNSFDMMKNLITLKSN